MNAIAPSEGTAWLTRPSGNLTVQLGTATEDRHERAVPCCCVFAADVRLAVGLFASSSRLGCDFARPHARLIPIRKLHPCSLKGLFDYAQSGSPLFAFSGFK